MSPITIFLIFILGLALYRPVRWWWRWVTKEGLIKFALLCTSLFVVLSAYNTHLQRRNSAVNSRVLASIEEQTSPEAVAAQQRQINAVLVAVDCNTRQAFQDAIRQLVNLGIPEAGSIQIVTAKCGSIDETETATTLGD